jgi:hypothetical protein
MQDAKEFWSGAADMLLEIQAREGEQGASPVLLAVTWMNEYRFHMRGLPNTNGANNTEYWDYGPFQLNKHWTNGDVDVWVKSKGRYGVSNTGLSDKDIYGVTADANSGFDGDPLANGRMASRKLMSNGGKTDRERAQRYTSPVNQRVRGLSYDNFAPLFANFFDCYRGGDSGGDWK